MKLSLIMLNRSYGHKYKIVVSINKNIFHCFIKESIISKFPKVNSVSMVIKKWSPGNISISIVTLN